MPIKIAASLFFIIAVSISFAELEYGGGITVCCFHCDSDSNYSKTALINAAQALEQYYAGEMTYSGAVDEALPKYALGDSPLVYEPVVTIRGKNKYRISAQISEDGQSYELYAWYIQSENEKLPEHYFYLSSKGIKKMWRKGDELELESWSYEVESTRQPAFIKF